MYRLGIDVDNETTTGILMDNHGAIMCFAKAHTSADLVGGISIVLHKIGKQHEDACMNIREVIMGTDYFGNALLEGKNLSKVCSVRIGQTRNTIPPLYGGSDYLQKAIGQTTIHITGGHEIDGSLAWIEPSRQDLELGLRSIKDQGIKAFAITGAFSPVNDDHEKKVAMWIREIVGEDCLITTSHELGSIGFLERENSAILNASLSKLITRSLKGLEGLIRKHNIEALIYFTQNDGSLMSYESVLRHPIRTFGSRVSNSFRGASLLTKLNDCVIVDVSQSRVSIGALEGGFPREKRRNQAVAGVRVNLQMPDIISLSLDGNGTTLVEPGSSLVGPDSIDDDSLDAIYHAIQRFQPRFEPLPIVFVGEGSERVASAFPYPWADVLHPKDYQNVSAIGACIAPVSGKVDRIYWLEEREREEIIQVAKAAATQAAIEGGAAPQSVFVQTVETIPLSYMPTKALRVKVKAIGTLGFHDKRQ
ncbi:MAG: Hydantoinase/oxoprolinase [Brevibacillus sp.]|nr:Hydantoinase/oxoprolinase [Brevibacillus sp.]